MKTNLSIPTPFGGITKFLLPAPLRNPNAVYVALDNSVWFGEQTIPGVGHLFQNGTLVEHAWPFNYPVTSNTSGVCIPRTETWGITFWNGRVWATDSTGNQLVGLDPATGDVQTVKVSGNSSFPYTLTVSPTGSLWFTELYNGKIGSLDQSEHLQEYKVPGDRTLSPPRSLSQTASSRTMSTWARRGLGTAEFTLSIPRTSTHRTLQRTR